MVNEFINMKYIYMVALFLLLFSCQEKFSGKDKKSFTVSREKIEKSLNEIEKINLEKAMRVIALEAMRLKWEEPDKYQGQSFNAISLNIIDGLSYGSLIDLAEDFLKNRNQKEIESLTQKKERLSLERNFFRFIFNERQKKEFLKIKQALNLFKITNISINKVDFFDEMVPELDIEYQYIGKKKLIGTKSIEILVKQKSTNKGIENQTIVSGDDQSVLESGEKLSLDILFSQTKESNPKLWNAKKYPIENPNLFDYDLELKVTVLSLVINGKKLQLPKINGNDLDVEIKANKEKINELKTIKCTLDELELTQD